MRCWQLDASLRPAPPTTLVHPTPSTVAAATTSPTPGTCYADRRVYGARLLAPQRLVSVTAHSVAVWDLARSADPITVTPVRVSQLANTSVGRG